MKKRVSLLLAVLLLAAALLCVGCGKSAAGNVPAKTLSALENSGLLAPFVEKSGDSYKWLYPTKLVVSDSGLSVSDPVYYIRWHRDGTLYPRGSFSNAEAVNGSFSDADALTKGTFVFICSEYLSKSYRSPKGEDIIGYRETQEVYLCDIASGTVFASKTFHGEELQSSYEDYGKGREFYNSVDPAEVKAWVESMRAD